MTAIDGLTEAYISAFETLMKADDDLEKAFKAAKASLPERVAYRKAEDALKRAVESSTH